MPDITRGELAGGGGGGAAVRRCGGGGVAAVADWRCGGRGGDGGEAVKRTKLCLSVVALLRK
jgi:hypothetical protein